MSDINKKRRQARRKRKISIRKKVHGTADRPRVAVNRSHTAIYAQVVDDDAGRTILSSDSRQAASVEAPEGFAGKCAMAYFVGRAIADKAKEQGIAAMVFDRSGYLYHGRVAALARGLRDGGIKV